MVVERLSEAFRGTTAALLRAAPLNSRDSQGLVGEGIGGNRVYE
jgi:hypothetical protein